jgi:hypothetical protein
MMNWVAGIQHSAFIILLEGSRIRFAGPVC